MMKQTEFDFNLTKFERVNFFLNFIIWRVDQIHKMVITIV